MLVILKRLVEPFLGHIAEMSYILTYLTPRRCDIRSLRLRVNILEDNVDSRDFIILNIRCDHMNGFLRQMFDSAASERY